MVTNNFRGASSQPAASNTRQPLAIRHSFAVFPVHDWNEWQGDTRRGTWFNRLTVKSYPIFKSLSTIRRVYEIAETIGSMRVRPGVSPASSLIVRHSLTY